MKTKASKVSSRYPTPALEKGLDILELFVSEPSGLTKSDVARKLGRTISEIFRMLLCLEERGYIAQSTDSERYHLTLHLFRLALEHPPIKRMTTQALPIMQQVAHDLSQSCHLGVLNWGQVVIIAQVDSPVSPGFYVKAGAVVDLMHSATGHVILAHLTQEARTRAIEGSVQSFSHIWFLLSCVEGCWVEVALQCEPHGSRCKAVRRWPRFRRAGSSAGIVSCPTWLPRRVVAGLLPTSARTGHLERHPPLAFVAVSPA